jgi:AmmeMemoRadiSam system protein B
VLPPLRFDLDAVPSPMEDRPGLLLRDSLHYSDAVLIIPPPLVECLAYFDGDHSELDLRALLPGDLATHLIDTLKNSGFLQDETFAEMKAARERAFAEAPVREPSHAGSGYPDDPAELREQMDEWMSPPETTENNLIGIAAPHVSPEGGYQSYRAAYGLLGPQYKDRTFVILGTSHYGAPDRFGLTRKPYATPWGNSRTDIALVDELTRRAPSAVGTEDYCHSVEHSIEFQVVYLQSIYGPDINILPILCGSYAESIYRGGKPEDNEGVAQFLDALGDIGAREGNRLFWVLGIDMAHMGRRYGDRYDAIAAENEMLTVKSRDQQRMDRIAAGDATGFWDLVQHNHDDLKWCGSSPLYTFLKVLPQVRGEVKRYEQWNIDAQSVVTFAGMSFRA